MSVITHLLTIFTNFQRDIQVGIHFRSIAVVWTRKAVIESISISIFFGEGRIFKLTLPETKIALENRPLEKEIPIENHHF